jgi:hypothetical protein
MEKFLTSPFKIFQQSTNYLEDVNTYLAAFVAGSTVASWNTIGKISVM